MIFTREQYGSTEFILTHNYALNKGTVDNYGELVKDSSRLPISCPKLPSTQDNVLWNWLTDNTYIEWRNFDCLPFSQFPDPDPIPELFPRLEMKYMAVVFDPDKADAFIGINDPTTLQTLYRSKYGPGTPQSFLYDTPILGWVMYYELGDSVWIVEIQANNTLSGSILSAPSSRTHVYRFLVSLFVSFWNLPVLILTKTEQQNLHAIIRPLGPRPLTPPYHKDVLSWCGFKQTTVRETSLNIVSSDPIQNIVGETKVWLRSH